MGWYSGGWKIFGGKSFEATTARAGIYGEAAKVGAVVVAGAR
jgi:hypothetical protein